MKKRIFSMLLAVILVVGLFPTAAFAATDTWAMELNVSENNLFQYNGQNVLELAYGAQSADRTLKNAQHSAFAVDLTVFDFLTINGTKLTDTLTTKLSKNLGGKTVYKTLIDENLFITWKATCKFAVSEDGNTGYVILQPNQDDDSFPCLNEVNLASILIGFKNGKSTTDLTKTSIRFMTADEAYSFAQSSVVSLTDGATKPQNYLPDNSTEPLLGVTPRVDWGTIAIPLPQLTGSVAISGTAKFGEALTATHSNLSEGATPVYQWYRGEAAIKDATAATYTIVEADIGSALTVKVSDSRGTYSGTVDAKPTAVVAKLDYTGAAATQAAVTQTADSVTVTNVTPGQEYAITTDKTEPNTGWQTTNLFTGLTPNTPYTVYTRVKATATTNASPSVTTNVTTSKLAQTLTRTDKVGSTLYVGGPNVTFAASTNASGDINAKTPTFTCADSSILTITTEGIATIVGAGTAHVKVNCGESDNYAAANELTFDVVVAATTANTLSIKGGNSTTMQYGDKNQIVLENNNNGKPVNYVSSDTNKLSVSAAGEVTVKSYTGTATITITQPMNTASTPIDGKTLTLTVTMNPKPLTFDTTALSATNRPYNGTSIVALTGTLKLGGIVAGDDAKAIGITTPAGASLTGTMANANAADGKAVTISGYGALTGTKAAYYTLPSAAPTKAVNIAKADIATWTTDNMGAITATKVYDSTGTNANVTFAGEKTISGQKGETFILTPKAAQKVTYKGAGPFNAADNGYSFDITWSNFALTGTATMSNYNVPSPLTYAASGTITKATQATLTLTGVTTTATYGDKKMTPIATGGTGTGTVTYAFTANADSAATLTDGGTKIQIEKPGSFTVQATKPADGNYNEATSAPITCIVSKKALTLNTNALSGKLGDGATGYDLSNSAVLTGYVTATVPDGLKSLADASATISYGTVTDGGNNVGGVIGGTALTWGTTNAGTFTFPVTMAENAYYTLTGTNVVTVTIDARTPQSIDFTTPAPATITYGDGDFTVTAAGGEGAGGITYASSDDTVATVNSATGLVHILKAGTVTITATKAEDATYAKATVNTGALNIVKKGLTVIDDTYAVTKVYDGTTAAGAAAGTLGLDGIEELDDVSLTGMVVSAYADKTAADNKTVSITGLSLTGAQAESYSVADTYSFAKAAITKKPVTLTTIATKVYDSNNVVALTDITSSFAHAAVDGIVDGETITVTAITGATYNTKDVHSSTALAAAGTPTYSDEATNYEIVWAPGNGTITTTPLTPTGATTLSKGTSEMSGLKVSDFLTSVTGNIAPDTKATLFDGAVTGALAAGAITVGPFTITFYTDAGRLTPAVAIPATAGTYYYKITGAAPDPYKTNYSLGTLSEVLGTLTVTAPIVPPPSGGGGGVTPSESIELKQPKTDPVTGNTNVEIVVKPETKGDTSTAVIPDKVMTDAISSVVKEAAKTGGTSSVEIVIDAPKDAKTVEAELTRTIIRAVAESEVGSLKITSPVAIITFDTQALATIAAEAVEEKVIISAVIVPEKKLDAAQKALVGDAPVYELKVMSGNKIISDFKGGTATITIPYELKAGEKAEFVTVWYLDDAGKLIPIQGKYEGGFVTFTVDHFSRYAIGYLPFTDVKADWAYESIVYAYQNKLLSGVGNEKFAPADNMTRAMLWTVLYRAAGSPAKTDNANWYADAQAWAMAEKISDGTNPTGNVTRQELATILYRHAKSTAVQADMSGFSDMAEVAEWAADGMNWAVANGILKGIGDKLNPAGNATRAQVATMLQRYLTK